jgi:hypothetical protein
MIQQNDIVKKDGSYRKIYAVIGDVAFISYGYSVLKDAQDAPKGCSTYAYSLSELSSCEIVERNGKPYVKEKWVPKMDQNYYIPKPISEQMYDRSVWRNDEIDHKRLESNFVFQTKEEAIECTEKMLQAVKI